MILQERPQTQHEESQKQTSSTYNNFTEYMFSLIGYCVGFGTFWRFPYLVYKNGGGAFLIPYLLCLTLVSIPMNYLEVSIGQLSRLSQPMLMQRINKGLKGFGLTYILVCLTLLSYLNILLVYSYRFILIVLFQDTENMSFKEESLEDNTYFHEVVLEKSESIQHFGHLNPLHMVLYVFSLLIVYFIIKNGVKTSGKITIFTAIMPYVIFFILIVRGLFLPGALQGLKVLFYPDFNKLLNFKIWSDGFNQAFFGMGISQATTVAFSSMKSKKERIISGVYILPISLLICGFMCAAIVYIYIGNYCHTNQIEISELTLEGPELSFSIFPKVLAHIPIPKLWLVVFFVAMVFLGIDSQFGILQTIYTYIDNYFRVNQEPTFCSEKFTLNSSKAKLIVIIGTCLMSFIFCSSAGIYYLAYFDNYGTALPFAIGAVIEIMVFVYVLPFYETQRTVESIVKEKVPRWIRAALQSPILVCLIMGSLVFTFVHQMLEYDQIPIAYFIFAWIYSLGPYLASMVYFFLYNETDEWRTQYREIQDSQHQLEKQKLQIKQRKEDEQMFRSDSQPI